MSKKRGKCGEYMNNPLVLVTVIMLASVLLFLTQPEANISGNAVLGEDFIGVVEGTWQVHEINDQTACDGTIRDTTYPMFIVQANEKVTMSSDKLNLKGEMKGNAVTSEGSFEIREGGVAIKKVETVVGEDCNSFEGKGDWDWTDGEKVCSGTIEVSGIRKTGDGCGVPPVCIEDWSCGEWGQCLMGKQVRTCSDAACGSLDKEETKDCAEQPGPEQPARNVGDIALMVGLIVVLILMISTVVYLIVMITSKKRKLANQLDYTIEKIYTSLNAGDKFTALQHYKELTGQFEKHGSHLTSKDKKRLHEEGMKAYDAIMKH